MLRVKFFPFSFNLTLVMTCFRLGIALDPPVVEIVSWMEADDYRWKSGSELEIEGVTINKTTFVIPGDIHGVVISCNAPYPIDWNFEPDEHLDPGLMIYSLYPHARREGTKEPFIFSMKLFMFGHTNAFTGKYICRKTGIEKGFSGDIKSEIYIFWEGNSPPYIMGAGKSIKVSSFVKPNIRLPCAVSFPDVEIFLQRKMNVTIPRTSAMSVHNSTAIPTQNNATDSENSTGTIGSTTRNDSTETSSVVLTEMKYVDLEFTTNTSATSPIVFDPSVGFIMDNTIEKNVSINGEYKCFTVEKDDFLIINVVPEEIIPKRSQSKDKLEGKATLSYNESTRHFVCCSNSEKPPSIVVFYCMSYAHCEMASKLLYNNMIVKLHESFSIKKKAANCASAYLYQGAYRCYGDGVDVTRIIFSWSVFSNGTRKREIYWSWSDITKEEQQKLVNINLQVVPKSPTNAQLDPWSKYRRGTRPPSTLYTGQNVSFTCNPASFYFADGVIWKIRWKNQTETPIETPVNAFDARRWFWTPPKAVSVLMHDEMQSVSCLAPIWNSTEWVEKPYIVTVKVPTEPSISSPDDENLFWTLNDTNKVIRCEAAGDPTPKLLWLKNGKKVLNKRNTIQLIRGNGSLTVKFLVAEYGVHGSYVCVAENIVNRAEKLFNVFIEEGHPWIATATITCVCLAFLTVIAILGWRLKVNHDVASELRWRTS